MKKEISFGKYQRLLAMSDSEVMVKLETKYINVKQKLSMFSSMTVVVVCGKFVYYKDFVYDHVDGELSTRCVYVRVNKEDFILNDYHVLSEVVLNGGINSRQITGQLQCMFTENWVLNNLDLGGSVD